MLQKLRTAARCYSDYRRFRSGENAPRIVFYAEGPESWPHFEPILAELTGSLGRRLAYVTSSPSDPVLKRTDPNLDTFCVGAGVLWITFFQTLRNALIVMTMPDLETFHIKRSRFPHVHYAYVFHSMVSTHMTYRKGAFDHFDTLLCVGPHHLAEIRATEKLHGLKAKELLEHGYGRLDAILRDNAGRTPPPRTGPLRVLLAPSWGANGVLETMGVPVIEALLQAGFDLTVRPHPQTPRLKPKLIAGFKHRFGGRKNFVLEESVVSRQSLLDSHVMISDWSGAALEYAFGLEKPVVFIDLPRKVNNPEYEKLPMPPLEVSIREKLGAVVARDDFPGLCRAVERLAAAGDTYRDTLRALRSETIFNLGQSGVVGAKALVQLFERKFGR